MKSTLFTLTLGILLITGVMAQPLPPAPAEFATLKPVQMDRILDTAENLPQLDESITAVIAARRMDLLKAIFDHRRTSHRVAPRISSLPDSPFRNSAVLMMLRTESPAVWDNTPYEMMNGSRPLKSTTISEPFRTPIKKYLPQSSLDDPTVFDSRQSRLELAAELETAMRHAGSLEPPAISDLEKNVKVDAWLESAGSDWNELQVMCLISNDGPEPHPFEFSVRAAPLYLSAIDLSGKEIQPTPAGRKLFMPMVNGQTGGGFMSNVHDREIPPHSTMLIRIPFTECFARPEPRNARITLVWNPQHLFAAPPLHQLKLWLPANPTVIPPPPWAAKYGTEEGHAELAWYITPSGVSISDAAAEALAKKMRPTPAWLPPAISDLKNVPGLMAVLSLLVLTLIALGVKRRRKLKPDL